MSARVNAVLAAIGDLRPSELLEVSEILGTPMEKLARASTDGVTWDIYPLDDSVAHRKIQAIKALRGVAGLPLKEAKDAIDGAVHDGKPIATGLMGERSEEYLRAFHSEGLLVERRAL